VERLHGQRRWLVTARGAPTGGYAGAHLDEAVEASAVSPGAGPAVGVEGAGEEGRVEGAQRLGVVAQAGEGVGAEAGDKEVGAGDQALEGPPALGVAQVEEGAALAGGGLRQQR